MTDIHHVTRRPHEEPPIRDDSGFMLGWALLLCAVVLPVGVAVL
jgi:hypothetical protein